ncbi:protein translocase subunit SecF [bacterium]|nr:protein translocase subunit SecF [bacterium]
MQFFKTPNIDFIGKRRKFYFLSLVLFLAGMASIFLHKGIQYGIDFKGGTSLVVRFEKPVTIGQIRDALSGVGLGGSEIKRFGAESEFIIYSSQQGAMNAADAADLVDEALNSQFPDNRHERLQVDTVGPKIGQELRKKAFMAVFFALVLMLVYISIRFEWVFAVGAVSALFHDVLITLGFFSIMGFELSLKEIAAFLTLVGYSLNDTIVVYDRIRENLKVFRNDELSVVMNKSINQTLNRTVNTGLTTLLAVAALYLLGGEVVRGFAFIMLFGILIGTYSSIFVAAPIVVEWQARHGGRQELRMGKKHKSL